MIILGVREAVRGKNLNKEGLTENKKMVGNWGENRCEIARVHDLYKRREGNNKNSREIQGVDFRHSDTGR